MRIETLVVFRLAAFLPAVVLLMVGISIASAQSAPGAAAQRPRVGLVLSGGGARGAAHIGVLKVLEEMHVPIDAIAGTSMGAVVGGLYAAGLSAQEIEQVIASVDWRDAFQDRPAREDLAFRRKQDDLSYLVRLPLGLKGRKILLPRGLIQGQKLTQTLRALTLPVARIERFDALPVPFRAVAADLATGRAVVFDHGDLATAMRASISAPGVFSPVEVDGQLLVDGGIAENLPVDIARSMGVDVLIVVDVSFPLLPASMLTSPLQISNQMLAILVRRDTERQRALLSARDIVIDPPLGEASLVNFTIVSSAIASGEQAARAAAPQLAALSVPQAQFSQYLEERRAVRDGKLPRIDFVRTDERSSQYRKTIDATLKPLVGQPLDVQRLETKIEDLYGLDTFETLDYRLVRDGDQDGLEIAARRKSWGPNYVRFGLNLQDDFEGNDRFNAAARFIVTEINSLGAEWVSDLQVGENPRLYSEFYQPLTYGPRFFLAPHVDFAVRSLQVLDQQARIAEFRVRNTEGGLDFGREFANWGELRTGILRGQGGSRILIGAPTLAGSRFDTGEFFVRFAYDKLNNVNFPRKGQELTLAWDADRKIFGADQASDRVNFDWLIARSRGRNTFILWTSAGTTLDSRAEVQNYFSLGGFLRLSGLVPNSISGPQFGLGRLIYYRQVGRGGSGILDVPAYVGLSLEAGNVWQQRSDASMSSTLKDGSVFLGLDTLLGPVYLGSGFDSHGHTAYYLFLGNVLSWFNHD
jgi:NTE family protein